MHFFYILHFFKINQFIFFVNISEITAKANCLVDFKLGSNFSTGFLLDNENLLCIIYSNYLPCP